MAKRKPNHVIQRHVFEVEIGSKKDAFPVHNEFSDLFYKIVQPILEKVFDRFDNPDEILRIEKLEIDLGNLNIKMLEFEVTSVLESAITRAFYDKLAEIPPKQIAATGKEGRIPLVRDQLETFLFVLEYGYLPVWVAQANYFPEELLDTLIEEEFSMLVSRLAALIQMVPAAARRLVTQFPMTKVEKLVDEMFAGGVSTMRKMVDTLTEELKIVYPSYSDQHRKAIAQEAYLVAAFPEVSANFNRQRVVKRVREFFNTEYKVENTLIFQQEPFEEDEADLAKAQAGIEGNELLRIANEILTGKLPLDYWTQLPIDQQGRLWDFLLSKMDRRAVSFLLDSYRVGENESGDSAAAQTWQYLIRYHTESLREALERADRVFEVSQMLAPVLPSDSLTELLEWVMPGRSYALERIVETLEFTYRKSRKRTMSEQEFKKAILKGMAIHFSQSSKPTFSQKEVAKAIERELGTIPKEVKQVLEDPREEITFEQYKDLPPVLVEALAISEDEELYRFLRHVIMFGEAPWWAPYSFSDFEPEMLRASKLKEVSFVEFIQSVFASVDSPAKKRATVKTLTERISPESLEKIISVVEPNTIGFVLTLVLMVERLLRSPLAPSQPASVDSYKWKPVLQYLLEKGKGETQTSDLIEAITFQLAADFSKSKKEIRDLLLRTIRTEVAKGENRFRPVESMIMSIAASEALRTPEAVKLEEESRILKLQREAAIAEDIAVQEELKNKEIRKVLAQKLGGEAAEIPDVELIAFDDLRAEWESETWEPRDFYAPDPDLEEEERARKRRKRRWLIVSGAGNIEPVGVSEPEKRIWREARNERIISSFGDSPHYEIDTRGYIVTDAEGKPRYKPNQSPEEIARLSPGEVALVIQANKAGKSVAEISELLAKERGLDKTTADTGDAETAEDIARKARERAAELGAAPPGIKLSEEDLMPGKPFEVLLSFLISGTIPTNFGNISKLEFENMIIHLIEERSRELRAVLQDKLRNEEVRNRIAKQLPLQLQEDFITLVKPVFTRNLITFSESFAKIFGRTGSPVRQEIIREHRFLYAVSSRQMAFSPILYIREMVAYAAKKTGREYFALIKWLDSQLEVLTSDMGVDMERAASIISRELADLEAMSPEVRKEREKRLQEQEKKEVKKENTKREPIYIQNSGIVILNKLLPFFFKNLGFLDDEGKNFRGESSQERAAFVLHNILFFKREMSEVELALNKILCGLDVSHPVTGPYTLTEKEENEILTLFKVIKSRWNYMEEKTDDDVRGTVMLREGRLQWDTSSLLTGHWVLRVNQKPYDTILSSWPYPFSEIKFDWMPQKLIVEWT